jgi:hypothetical protein
MRHRIHAIGLATCIVLVGNLCPCGTVAVSGGAVASRTTADEACPSRPPRSGLPVPVVFEPNRGQARPGVEHLARFRAYTALLGRSGVDLVARGERLRVRWVGFEPGPARPTRILPGRSHYFRGNDRRRWVRDVPHHAGLTCRDEVRGVDVSFRAREGRLRFDLVLGPGADPTSVGFALEGEAAPRLRPDGSLVVRGESGEFALSAPVCWQEVDDRRVPVLGRYRIDGPGRVGFVLGAYDDRRAVVIDPTVPFATYLGGSLRETNDFGLAACPDGSLVVAGSTSSTDFPTTTGAYMATDPKEHTTEVFVARLDATGKNLLFSTYLGGVQGGEGIIDVAVDRSGCPYALGMTTSLDFPTTPGAHLTSKEPGGGSSTGFLMRILMLKRFLTIHRTIR